MGRNPATHRHELDIRLARIGPVRITIPRGGRPDLVGEVLPKVKAPTLLIVGGNDEVVIGMNQKAYAKLTCEKQLKIVPGATHLFEEPGTLEQVAQLASTWFENKLQPRASEQDLSTMAQLSDCYCIRPILIRRNTLH